MRVRRIWPAALLAFTPVLAACDGSGLEPLEDRTTSAAPSPSEAPPSARPTPTESASATEVPTDATSTAPAKPLPAACDVVDAAQASEALGYQFGPGEPAQRECTFVAPGQVTAAVLVANAAGCTQPPEDDTIIEPVADVAGASRAWWVVSNAPPLRSLLRACQAGATVDVRLTYQADYVNDPRNDSIALAEKILAQLS